MFPVLSNNLTRYRQTGASASQLSGVTGSELKSHHKGAVAAAGRLWVIVRSQAAHRALPHPDSGRRGGRPGEECQSQANLARHRPPPAGDLGQVMEPLLVCFSAPLCWEPWPPSRPPSTLCTCSAQEASLREALRPRACSAGVLGCGPGLRAAGFLSRRMKVP